MHIRCHPLNVIWKFAIAAVAGVGVLMQMGVIDGSTLNLNVLGMFTILSNLLVALYFLVDGVFLLAHPGRSRSGEDWWPAMKHVAFMAILLTDVVANTLISGMFDGMTGTEALSMRLLHVASPLMVFADWLLLERKGRISAIDPLKWTIFPLLYLAFVFVGVQFLGMSFSGGAGSAYPYPFLDVTTQGVSTVATTVLAMAVAYLGCGYLLFVIDHLLGKISGK